MGTGGGYRGWATGREGVVRTLADNLHTRLLNHGWGLGAPRLLSVCDLRREIPKKIQSPSACASQGLYRLIEFSSSLDVGSSDYHMQNRAHRSVNIYEAPFSASYYV
eukprot:1179822-Prorocentrum_minimum.AAC.3